MTLYRTSGPAGTAAAGLPADPDLIPPLGRPRGYRGRHRRPRTPKTFDPPDLLTRAEVAALFRVAPQSVTRWADAGRLDTVRTPGGHRRYRAGQVFALMLADDEDGAR